MRFMNVKPSAFLVREKRFNTEALCIPATGVLGVHHITEQVQRLLIPLRPTTEHHHWTIGLPSQGDRILSYSGYDRQQVMFVQTT